MYSFKYMKDDKKDEKKDKNETLSLSPFFTLS